MSSLFSKIVKLAKPAQRDARAQTSEPGTHDRHLRARLIRAPPGPTQPVPLAALLPAVLPSRAQCQAQVSHGRVGLMQQASVELEVVPQASVAPVTDRHAGGPGPLDEPVRVVTSNSSPARRVSGIAAAMQVQHRPTGGRAVGVGTGMRDPHTGHPAKPD
jgi:hypothetical protein